MIRSVETGEERELYPEAALQNLQWSPDGRSILCGKSLQIIDVQTGDVTPIAQSDPTGRIHICGAEWACDGKAVFSLREVRVGPWYRSIIAHDLETGKEKELHKGGISWAGLAVSPDGRRLVFADGRALKVMPTVGGKPREFHRLQDTRMFAANDAGSGFEWTADGRYILLGIHRPGRPGPTELWRVPVGEGRSQKLLEMAGLKDISVHPDGRRIAFTGGRPQMEVWAMENFLTMD